MKISDFIFRFTFNTSKRIAGICRVRLFANMNKESIYAVLSELDENPYSSVTNSIEYIVAQLLFLEKIPENAIIIEHYPKHTYVHIDEFDIVSFDALGHPSWSPINMQKCLQFLDCDENEFADYKNDTRVQKEIYDAIKGIPRIEQIEYIEEPEITERRLEIKDNQYKLADVKDLLASNPTETEMGSFIKKDMSLIAEVFAHDNDEYICFSEFPVGSGRADYVVFTGRSRMSVYIIEIKGANLSLRKKNHYDSFRASIQEGKDQLEERAKYCQENYEKFRRFTYSVLDDVKNNKRPYNAFLGPNYQLQVDPNKDIRLTYVLIAGRTSDDLQDSQKRNTAENSSNLNIQIETWDSWLNKLSRP